MRVFYNINASNVSPSSSSGGIASRLNLRNAAKDGKRSMSSPTAPPQQQSNQRRISRHSSGSAERPRLTVRFQEDPPQAGRSSLLGLVSTYASGIVKSVPLSEQTLQSIPAPIVRVIKAYDSIYETGMESSASFICYFARPLLGSRRQEK